MSRGENRTTPKVISGLLYTDDVATTGTPVGSPAWFEWLQTATTFYYESHRGGTFTAHQERRQRGGQYWTAYRRSTGLLRRRYLGKADQLGLDHLEAIAADLDFSPARRR